MATDRTSARWAILAVASLLVRATLAFAQQQPASAPQGEPPGINEGAFGNDRLMLLMRAEVQSDLKLTEQQKTKVRELFRMSGDKGRKGISQGPKSAEERLAAHWQSAKETEQGLKEILTPQQQERLIGIGIQSVGVAMLQREDVAEKLNLTPEQRSQVTQVMKESREKMLLASTGNSAPGQSTPQVGTIQDRTEKVRKETEEKALALLTPEQKEQWEQMKGRPVGSGSASSGRPGGRPAPIKNKK